MVGASAVESFAAAVSDSRFSQAVRATAVARRAATVWVFMIDLEVWR
jgi:hypothetical protein